MPLAPQFHLKDGQKEWLIFIVAIIAACLIMLGGKIVSSYKAKEVSSLIQNMAPHRATYAIALNSLKSGQQVTNVQGVMTFEWNATCDASISNQHFDMNYEYQNGEMVSLVSNFSTYEPHTGQSLEFTSKRINNGELVERIRGFADHGTGTITYTKPGDRQETLSPSVLFPTSHTVAIIKAMQGRAKFLSVPMFGGDLNGPVEISAFIAGKAPAAKQYADEVDQTLLEAPARNLRLAFFPATVHQGQSEYEMSAIFHENGIMRNVLIEYDGFSVVQKLVALEKLDRQCDNRDE